MNGNRRAFVLLTLGLLNLAGVAVGSGTVSGLAMATAASPAPKVFTTHRGLETFSNTFTLKWTDREGDEHVEVVDPSDYRGIRGPYNRRNVFGAVLAYGPVLASEETTRPMFDAVSTYALCGDAPLLRELRIDPESVSTLEVVVTPRSGSNPDLPLTLEAPCYRS